jgi:hypothetical protein
MNVLYIISPIINLQMFAYGCDVENLCTISL